MDILALWILYGVLGVVVFSLLFLWAVRNRQFSDQERARYLVLEGLEEIPASPSDGEGSGGAARRVAPDQGATGSPNSDESDG